MLSNQLNVPLTNGQTNYHQLLYDHSATYLNAPVWAHLELTRHNNSAQWYGPIRSSPVIVLTIVQPIWTSLSEPILSSRQQEFFIYSRSIMSSPDITRVVKKSDCEYLQMVPPPNLPVGTPNPSIPSISKW